MSCLAGLPVRILVCSRVKRETDKKRRKMKQVLSPTHKMHQMVKKKNKPAVQPASSDKKKGFLRAEALF